MDRQDWNRLKHIQLGRYAEYLVKMECALHGLDVYTAEVDDKGVDFVVRAHVDTFYDIQVKSLRPPGYVFMQKDRFDLRPTNLLALVLFFTRRTAAPLSHPLCHVEHAGPTIRVSGLRGLAESAGVGRQPLKDWYCETRSIQIR